jgi:hypothetical protein
MKLVSCNPNYKCDDRNHCDHGKPHKQTSGCWTLSNTVCSCKPVKVIGTYIFGKGYPDMDLIEV